MRFRKRKPPAWESIERPAEPPRCTASRAYIRPHPEHDLVPWARKSIACDQQGSVDYAGYCRPVHAWDWFGQPVYGLRAWAWPGQNCLVMAKKRARRTLLG